MSEEWKMTITKVLNGYKVNIESCENNGEMVIQQKKDDEIACNEELLWNIIDFFNMGGSKHDKERIAVKTQKKGIDY